MRPEAEPQFLLLLFLGVVSASWLLSVAESVRHT